MRLTVTDADGGTGTVTHEVTVTSPPANVNPTAAFTWTTDDLEVSVNGTTSSDTDGTVNGYAWDFGDGNLGTGVTTTHTYAVAGTYEVTLTVTDDDTATDTQVHSVTVTAPPAPGVLAQDAFGRTLATGWGTADTGGAWTLSGAANLFGVSGGAGTMSVGAGKTPAAHLNSVSSTNTELTADVSIDRLPNTGSVYLDLVARGDNSNAYRGRLLISSTGGVQARLIATVAGTETALVTNQVAGLTYTAGTVLHVRMQATGSGTTALKLRVWKDGAAEPATWQSQTTNTTAALQVPRGVGVRAYVSARWPTGRWC